MTNESLLKMTDYPFAYSAVGLLMGHFGLKLFETQNLVVFVAAAGFLGTFLATVDPIARLVRIGLLRTKLKNPVEEKDIVEKYWESAINIRGINIEIKKIVGFIYFATSIVIFSISLHNDSFTEQFLFQNPDGEVICDKLCVTVLGSAISVSTLLILGYEAVIRSNKLNQYANIAVWYLSGIDSPYATDSTRESLNNSIERQDWKTAEYWKKRMQEDIKYKRGKRDIVIKSAESVYKPLLAEMDRLEESVKAISSKKSYFGFNFGAWSAIKEQKNHLMIDDPEFRKNMDMLQEECLEYDELFEINESKIKQIINKKFSTEYKKPIHEIQYHLKTLNNQFPSLTNCIFFDVHPTEYYGNKLKPENISFAWMENNKQEISSVSSEHDFQKFDEIWNSIKNDTMSDPNLIRMKELFRKISRDYIPIKQKCQERFELQYLV